MWIKKHYSPLRRLIMIAAIANQAKKNKEKQKEKADRETGQPADPK